MRYKYRRSLRRRRKQNIDVDKELKTLGSLIKDLFYTRDEDVSNLRDLREMVIKNFYITFGFILVVLVTVPLVAHYLDKIKP
jgi:hypothetical protein